MKNSRKEKKIRGHGSTPAQSAPAGAARMPRSRWMISLLCLVLGGGGGWAFFEFVVWNKVPDALVGKWVVTEGPQEGATFDLFRGGTLVGKVNLGGKEGVVNA